MQNLRNSIILPAMIFVVALACTPTDKIESLSAGCVTANGEKIGVGVKGKVFSIAAEDGKIIKDLEVIRKEGAIICSPENEVFVVYSDEIVNVESGKKYPRRIAKSTIIGINAENNLVGHQKIKIGKQRGEELELFVEKPFDQSDDLKPINLSLEHLGAVQRNKSSFLTKPIKLLKDNELLVFAGGKARELPPDDGGFGSDIWGFYKVDLDNGEISTTNIVDKTDDVADLFNPPFTDATLDGKLVATTFSNTGGKVGFVFDLETGKEIFKSEFYKDGTEKGGSRDQIQKFKAIKLSNDGSKLAVAGEWNVSEGRVYKSETIITIYDIKSGDLLSEYKFENGIIDIINFDNNELIVDFDNASVAKINATDGKNIWIKQLVKQR